MNEGIVEIIITGEVTKKTLYRPIHTEVISIMKGKNFKAVLCDVSTLKGRYEDFADAYFRARSIPEDILTLPSAVVYITDNESFKSFYETTTANIGQLMRWFTNIGRTPEPGKKAGLNNRII